MGWSENLAAWADLYYVNYWDNNIHAAYHFHDEHPEWHKPIYACRAIDWEVWVGLARDQTIINWVDVAISIAPHMDRRLRSEREWGDKLHLIPCGIDTERFSMKKKWYVEGKRNVILPCNEIDWVLKNVPEGLKIFAMLRRKYVDYDWRLYIRGKWCQGEYFKIYIQDLITKLDLQGTIEIIDQEVPDYNEFLEKMDYCLLPSYKEAFSYVTGECAAKGIKPILNWWYGAEEIWPKQWLYTTPDQAVEMFVENYNPKDYRDYIIEHKNVETMLAEFDRILGT